MQQPLATDDALFRDKDNSHLHAVFEHDFVTDGLDQNRFALIYGALGKQFKETPKGLMASRKADRGYKNTTIAPYLQVYGDFDITVAYSEFKSEPAPTGSGRLLLVAMFEGENTEEVLIQRGHFVNKDGIQNQTLQAVVVENKRGGQSRQHFGTRSHEEVAGRLRLSRRGNMIYYLSAEGESPNFRILASREFSTSAIRSQGIRIINMTHQK